MDEKETIEAIQKLRRDDIIIAFTGPAGAGKSHFIDLLTGGTNKGANPSLKSGSSVIQATRVYHPKYGSRMVLVDTPGFDDAKSMYDVVILAMISNWLEKTYDKNVKLSGLIHLHRITDNRMAGSPHKYLSVFSNLCGDSAASRLTLVTTMWEGIDPKIGANRESQLRDEFWGSLIEKGSDVDRLQQSNAKEAWRIVEKLVERSSEREKVLLQEEIVNLGQRLSATDAGRALFHALQALLTDQKNVIMSLAAQAVESDDLKPRAELEKEYKKIQAEFERKFKEVNRLEIPLGRRIVMFFFGKKTYAKAIKIAGAGNIEPTVTGALASMMHIEEAVASLDVRKFLPRFARSLYRVEDPDSVRTLLLNVIHAHQTQAIANVITPSKLVQQDVQLLVDYLDLILRESGNTRDGEQNRILRLLSKVVASYGVIPKYYEIQPIRIKTENQKRGSTGTVYMADKDDTLCVKMIDSEGRSEEHIKEMILWAHTSHANILPLAGVFFKKNPPRTAFVSIWMQNGNLEDYVKVTQDGQDARVPLLTDIIAGLAHLHERNIVHSDLKGANVLISDDKRALITDFGSSHIYTATAPNNTGSAITCTWHFAAPELLPSSDAQTATDERPRPTKQCDIWAYGGICYQVLSRKVPYEKMDLLAIQLSVLSGIPPKRPSAGPDEIEEDKWQFLIACCWALQPQERSDCERIGCLVRSWWSQTGRPEVKPLRKPSKLPPPANPKINFSRLRDLTLRIEAKLQRTESDSQAISL